MEKKVGKTLVLQHLFYKQLNNLSDYTNAVVLRNMLDLCHYEEKPVRGRLRSLQVRVSFPAHVFHTIALTTRGNGLWEEDEDR